METIRGIPAANDVTTFPDRAGCLLTCPCYRFYHFHCTDTEVSEPEECQGTDEPVPVFKSPASMCSSTTDLQ